MADRLKPVDVVVVGMGVAGTLIAKELTAAGLRVVGLERGPIRSDGELIAPDVHDELRFARRYELMQDLSRETVTFRNSSGERALPMRQYGSFLMGDGVGGAGLHWGAMTWRFSPWDFETRSRTEARYGRGAFPEDCTSQDWGITYDQLEPFYDRFEYAYGVSGRAGNLRGERQPGGNPFEGPRSRDYPNPPLKTNYSSALFAGAATGRGYSPFAIPAAIATRPYTNEYGARLQPCIYCGFCERFGCEMSAKASPRTTVLTALLSDPHFELRTHANVLRVNVDPGGKRATGVTYIDGRGNTLEQPAEIVVLAAYVFNNVRLMLLSGIGRPYDPATGNGTVGRNYSYQLYSTTTLFFEDKVFNRFMGAGALGSAIDDFNGDNFDHGGLGFVGGGAIWAVTQGIRPIDYHPVPAETPRWGSGWKQSVARYFNRSFTIGVQGGTQSYRSNYLDLDPTYRDSNGLPLLRMTFDFQPNDHKMIDWTTDRVLEIAAALSPKHLLTNKRSGKYTITSYQSTHNTGGAVMGSDPATSALNPHLQSWDVPNVFVVGANAFPQNPGYNPTGTVGALSYRLAAAIRTQYLDRPGQLIG